MPTHDRLLLIDDDPQFVAVMARRLARHGWSVRAVQTGAAALSWLSENSVELLVLDLRLEDMGAGELIDALRQAGQSPEFVIITAFGDERVAVEMMKQGARDYLMKDAAIFEMLPVVLTQALARIQQERRLAEVERSLRLLDLAVSNAHDGIAVLSAEPEPRILYANPAFRMAHRHHADRVTFEHLHDAPAAEVLSRLQQGEVSQRRVHRDRAGALPSVVDSALTPVQAESGPVEHFIAVQRDISHSARLEERIQQAQTLEAVGQLAGGVAHDFNNLLTIILGHASLALQTAALPELAQESLERIQQAARSGAQLVSQLLTFSRRQQLSPQIIDLNDVVRDLSRMLRRTIGTNRRLEDHLHGTPLPVYVDPAQMQRVLLNLVVNARDAMPSGGIVRIRTEAGTLPPGPQPCARLIVEDEGIGMSPEVLAHIFEPFFTTKGPGKGTGLGLSTAYAVIQQSGGQIQAQSAPGQGSRFTITLPLALTQPSRNVPQHQTILLAEDDDVVRQLVRITLERAGYQVLEASSGSAARETLTVQPLPVDLLISDIRMPDLDGRILAREARHHRPTLPILLISGFYSGPGDMNLPLLQKPFTAEQLLQSVQDLLP